MSTAGHSPEPNVNRQALYDRGTRAGDRKVWWVTENRTIGGRKEQEIRRHGPNMSKHEEKHHQRQAGAPRM